MFGYTITRNRKPLDELETFESLHRCALVDGYATLTTDELATLLHLAERGLSEKDQRRSYELRERVRPYVQPRQSETASTGSRTSTTIHSR